MIAAKTMIEVEARYWSAGHQDLGREHWALRLTTDLVLEVGPVVGSHADCLLEGGSILVQTKHSAKSCCIDSHERRSASGL